MPSKKWFHPRGGECAEREGKGSTELLQSTGEIRSGYHGTGTISSGLGVWSWETDKRESVSLLILRVKRVLRVTQS